MIDLTAGGYATLDAFTTWLAPAEVPDTAPRLLRSASLRVALACQRNIYIDTPSDAEAVPLSDATCAQAAVWVELGVTPDQIAGAAVAVKRSKILTAEVENDTSVAAKRLDAAINDLAPEAAAILTAAGLIYQPVPASDTSGYLPDWGLGTRRWPSWGLDPSLDLAGADWPFV